MNCYRCKIKMLRLGIKSEVFEYKCPKCSRIAKEELPMINIFNSEFGEVKFSGEKEAVKQIGVSIQNIKNIVMIKVINDLAAQLWEIGVNLDEIVVSNYKVCETCGGHPK